MTWIIFAVAVLTWFAVEFYRAPLSDDLEPNEVSLWKSIQEDER